MDKWLVIIDGTQLYSVDIKINDKCLELHYNGGTEQETVNYHIDVLEAKIYFGSRLVCSICSEFTENNGEDAENYKNMSEELRKQDSELRAFKRLAEKLKKAYPRLPILLLMDSLYAAKPVMDICKRYEWNYIIRFKDGSIPYIAKEYKDRNVCIHTYISSLHVSQLSSVSSIFKTQLLLLMLPSGMINSKISSVYQLGYGYQLVALLLKA